MNVVMRADASAQIGMGHVVRCLTLAAALRERGVTVLFVCKEHPGHLCKMIEAQKFTVFRLPVLGDQWEADARQTIEVIAAASVKAEWIVVDHYALDERWERELRPHAERIMVIDDLADRGHDCDLLLDQNLVAHLHTRYEDRVPPHCGLLLGPEYAILQATYEELHDRSPPRSGSLRRILVFFGAADNENLTGRTVAAFLALGRSDVELDVVVMPSASWRHRILEQAAGHDNIHIHSELPTLAPLMLKADLAVGAGGTTSWERLCVGLPALVVTLAANQQLVAQGLSEAGLVRWLGHSDKVDQQALMAALERVLREGLDEHWSLRCLSAVDGKGARRVCAALTAGPKIHLQARHARLSDEDLLLAWANDSVTRRNSFTTAQITAAAHRAWFHAHLRDVESCSIYIVETVDGVPLGQVRFDRSGELWMINYAMAPQFRGRGCGRGLLSAGLVKFRGEHRGAAVMARVKESNLPSRRIFESLDFRAQSSASGVLEYRSASSNA